MGLINYIISAALLLNTCAAVAAEETCPGADVTDRQSVGSFMSIIDGQPAAPDTPQAQLVTSYNKNSGQFQTQFVGGIVFVKTGIFCQSQLTVTAPALIAGSARTQFQNSVTAAWEQRWVIDNGHTPTISSQLSFQVPYNNPGAKVDIVATFIAAKNLPHGVAYVNAILESPNGFDANIFNWAVITGYKHIIHEGFEIFGDIFVQKGAAVGFEAAVEWDLTDGVSIGPGISVVTNQPNNRSTDVTIGVNLSRGF